MADRRSQATNAMTPTVRSEAWPAAHPRRPPAHRSVSLLHSSRKRPAPPAQNRSVSSSEGFVGQTSQGDTDSGSPSSLIPLGRDSSGESSNVEGWFEKSNNDVRDNGASFADTDPPFFMRAGSSGDTPPVPPPQAFGQFAALNNATSSLPLRTGLKYPDTDGSSTEDFRGVIDDLTIENKKLKRRLKKYEKFHDSHLRDEKLFEVRIHGLPADKKRELEETLRKFATGLGTKGYLTNGDQRLFPAARKHDTTSSQTSFHHTDSAYASMSASGQGSSAQSGNESRHMKTRPSAASLRQNVHSNIHTYLHHIPEGLLPQNIPANMTERARKRLVVRRLEQIFAGKGAAVGGHQHTLQQQDVSQMAARADRADTEAQGQHARREGNREACIMLQEAEDPADPAIVGREDSNISPKQDGRPGESHTHNAAKRTNETGNILGRSEQRPTRPLDLDPHRAQVPEENIRYMRHLGFSPPDSHSRDLPEEGHGWVYLNLLINMAQLHTINVTPEFVKEALTEYSAKFELSQDGRKVRWRSGQTVTRTNSSGSGTSSRNGLESPDRRSPRKRPKLTHGASGIPLSSSTFNARAGGASGSRSQTEHNKLVYTPLFFHKDSTDSAEDSSEEGDSGMSSPFVAPVAGDSSGMTGSGIRAIPTRVRRRDDGPIIFYNNAQFCTDLSGDRRTSGNVNAPSYVPATENPLGKPSRPQIAELLHEARGPLAQAAHLPEPMAFSDNPIPPSMELSFPQQAPLGSRERGDSLKSIPLEVTGIGGVWPTDNFAIAVETRHARPHKDDAPSLNPGLSTTNVPARLAHILHGPERKSRAAVHRHIVATDTRFLPPSSLPAALSFMAFGEDSLEDDESEIDDAISVLPESPGALPPCAAPQPVELHYAPSEDDYDEDDEDDDDESDGSVDLLATAREADPEAVREQEREYDANMAERLAEEIPAGSSAATVGGGASGFASPTNGMNREDYERAVKEARLRSAIAQRLSH